MLMYSRVMLKQAGAFTALQAAFAVLPHRFVNESIIEKLDAPLVWTAWAQGERK